MCQQIPFPARRTFPGEEVTFADHFTRVYTPGMFLFELGHCETAVALQEALVELRRHLNISTMPRSLLRL